MSSSQQAHSPLLASNFEFLGVIEEHHVDILAKRGISKNYALDSGVSSRRDNELRKVGFGVGDKAINGLCFEYRNPWDKSLTWRLRPDVALLLNGATAKYLSRAGDPVRAYLSVTKAEELENSKIPVIITEGEMKALAIGEAATQLKMRYAVIGLAGVNGGWRREKEIVPLPDGTHEKRSHGSPKLIDDLDDEHIPWYHRRVYIVFDSDVGTHKHAAEFKKSKYSGAIGAEYTLAELLRARGAEVRIVVIPEKADGKKVGADDYIAAYGPRALFTELLAKHWCAYRDPDKILYRPPALEFKVISFRDLRDQRFERPPFLVADLLPRGGTMLLAGAPKVGKTSLGLVLAKNVAEGSSFLDRWETTKGRSLYIQAEMPEWALSMRMKNMGELPDNCDALRLTRFHFNLWEEHGFKRVETSNADRIAQLVELIKNRGYTFISIDPLSRFHGLNENTSAHVAHLWEVFTTIADATRCALCIVHHHRKTGTREEKYEGAEDLRGSIAMFAETDCVLSVYHYKLNDGTCRYKLITTTRHAEEPEPLEIYRLTGDVAMLWGSRQWEDAKEINFLAAKIHNKILGALNQGPSSWEKISDEIGKARATTFRYLRELLDAGKIRKTGNVFYLGQPDASASREPGEEG